MNRPTAAALGILTLSLFPSASFAETKTAIFAGGCFWCVESDFDRAPGVISTLSGYTGGHVKNPVYGDVTSEQSGHREAVKIEYDSTKTDYAKLLDAYWHSTDPTDATGQFCDKGESYTPAIFVMNAEEKALAEKTKAEVAAQLGTAIATQIIDATEFWPAEDFHQNYYQTHNLKYSYYRNACGRDDRIASLWGKDAHRGLAAH
jgi:peptide-methionine (S)-S-oxide reductase